MQTRGWIWRAAVLSAIVLAVAIGIRWFTVWKELNEPARRSAWEHFQREGKPDYLVWQTTVRDGRELRTPRFNPYAAKLWLAMGHDPNGDSCVGKEKRPPNPFARAILRPLALCNPRNSGQMPFVQVVAHGYSREALEVARLMIEAGANVNGVAPDGIVPLRTAVLRRNEHMVKLLLDAGADPLLKPTYSQTGDLSSAFETAESLYPSPEADRIRHMVRTAVERRKDSPKPPK